MHVTLGIILGCLTGWIAWLVAERFVLHYQREETDEPATDEAGVSLYAVAGSTQYLGAFCLASMSLWGAYVGCRASRPELIIALIVMTGVLLAISIVDAQTHRIPNQLILVALGWAALQVIFLGYPDPRAAALGALVGGGGFLLLAVLGRGALGAGDVKLAAVIGALLGYPAILPALFFGVLAGGVGALIFLATRRKGRRDAMAYGPYLAIGALIVVAMSL